MATKKKRRWTQLSSTRAPDPRIPEDSPDFGKRMVLITVALDDDGLMWERVGREPPTCLGRPPERDRDQ